MILLDYIFPDQYKRQPFAPEYTAMADIVRRAPDLARTNVETTEADRETYERKKEALFDGLGEKDPDTIPRNLILLAGKIKLRSVLPGRDYVARNRRFKRDNIITYADALAEPTVCILDPTYKRRDLIEFIRRNSIELLNYMATTLPVDGVYYDDLAGWIDRLGDFYDAANIH